MKLKPKKIPYKSFVQITMLLLGAALLVSPVSASHRQQRSNHAKGNCHHRDTRPRYSGFWFNYGPPAVLTACSNVAVRSSGCCNSDRVWIDGYWDWFNGGYIWIEGYWSVRPRGSHWVKGHWQRRGGRRVWEPAHWSKW
ncbi:MAG: BcpO-related WXXGXW repeat protein [FCB group bacterium]|nr:BcpO-related WXXGXW repeat protein [FCB group bacterium]